MKKDYLQPKIEVSLMEIKDVLTTSGDNDVTFNPDWVK